MGENLVQDIRAHFSMPDVDVRTMAPLSLAYVGDAVYELVLRTVISARRQVQVHYLHEHVTKYVSAKGQAELAARLKEHLTEEEQSVFRRGRNAKSFSVPKNASVSDYRAATGLEALCGYLYLTGKTERLLCLLQLGLEQTEEQSK